jgi:nucleoside-diphosphate-sugar epimerase
VSDVFLTGVTGFLGRYLAVRLLDRASVDRLVCLVRATDPDHGRARVLRSLGRAAPDRACALLGRIDVVTGDLVADGLGLHPADRRRIAAGCRHFIHSAADVRFDQPLDDARSRNVQGTLRVLELARQVDGLERFDYVGTAFVAGRRTDLVREDELEHEAGWKNTYEQSKYEAELALRTQAGGLPLTVFRPSIVVGESASGATTNFGMLYWPIQLYAKGWWRTVVGRPEVPVDFVPVDFVADAFDQLTRPGRPVGATYHLAAGPDGARRIEQLAALCQRWFDGPPARHVDPSFFMRWVRPLVDLFLLGRRGRVVREGGRFFVPYFSGNPLFDVSTTRAALADSGLAIPDVEDYFDNLLDYCVRTDFGKRPEGAPTVGVSRAASG